MQHCCKLPFVQHLTDSHHVSRVGISKKLSSHPTIELGSGHSRTAQSRNRCVEEVTEGTSDNQHGGEGRHGNVGVGMGSSAAEVVATRDEETTAAAAGVARILAFNCPAISPLLACVDGEGEELIQLAARERRSSYQLVAIVVSMNLQWGKQHPCRGQATDPLS